MKKLLTSAALCGMLLLTGCEENPADSAMNGEMQKDPGVVTDVLLEDDMVHVKRVVDGDIYIDSYHADGYVVIDNREGQE